ncbi:MAG: alcohol dehydrogenase catalytic domain-containing protein [Thaumarchaeota archaeon]|nr:alcohol dehydrogenase catalytic domain-containing protein [Nitrososphaerota archaeon]
MPKRNQVLLKVEKVGICGTDRDIIKGQYGEAPEGSDHLVLVHESIGRVEEVGVGVRNFRRGDLVVPAVRRNCPENCASCRNGRSDLCLTGHYREHGIRGLHGFASEYATTDWRFVARMPESLSQVGVLLEPLTIVEKSVEQTLGIGHARMK